MKTFLTWIFAGMTLCALCLAQDTTPPQVNSTAPQGQQSPAPAPPAVSAQSSSGQLRIAPGSVIPVQLTKNIDAKKAKTGNPVEAKVTQDLKAENGEIIVPKDTKVVGHVTEVQARTKEQKESQIGIAFDHAVIKNRGDLTLPMSIQAIIAPPTLNSNNRNPSAGSPVEQSSVPNFGGVSPGNNVGRSSGMGTETPPQVPIPSQTAGDGRTNSQTGASVQRITGNTQGVVGISSLKLSMASDTAQGSVVSSEMSNVKLESGTFMLLRVNP